MPRQIKPYRDFRGGLNVDSAPDNLADNEVAVADNVNMDKRGGLSKRKGTAPLNLTSYATQVEQTFEWPRNSGVNQLMGIIGTDLCKIADDGTKTIVQALSASCKRLGWFFNQDKLYSLDGVTYRVYDGTTSAAVVAASGADLTAVNRCKYALRHTKSLRFFFAGDSSDPSALYYSEPGDPTNVKLVSKLYPTSGEGPITGIAEYGDAVMISYKGGWRIWRGIDPLSDAIWEKLPISQGALSSAAITLTQNSLTFLGRGGIYALPPSILSYTVTVLPGEDIFPNLAKNRVTGVIRGILDPTIARAVYDPYNERYLLAYCDSGTRNNKILVYDWGLGAFTKYTGLTINDFCYRANGDLLIASNNYILKMEQAYKDWDVSTGAYKAVSMEVDTKSVDLDYPIHWKKVKKMFVATQQYTAETSTLDVEVWTGYKSVIKAGIPLDESFAWGDNWELIWGWTDFMIKEIKCVLKGARFRVVMKNSVIDQPLTVYGCVFDYRVHKPKGVKV